MPLTKVLEYCCPIELATLIVDQQPNDLTVPHVFEGVLPSPPVPLLLRLGGSGPFFQLCALRSLIPAAAPAAVTCFSSFNFFLSSLT